MSTEEILSQIDAALGDWSVGPDAMRCNATKPAARVAQTVLVVHDIADPAAPTVAELSAASPVGFCYGGLDLSGVSDGHDWGPLEPLPASYSVSFTISAIASQFIANLFGIRLHRPRRDPAPLPINGHAYHRRRRNRR